MYELMLEPKVLGNSKVTENFDFKSFNQVERINVNFVPQILKTYFYADFSKIEYPSIRRQSIFHFFRTDIEQSLTSFKIMLCKGDWSQHFSITSQ